MSQCLFKNGETKAWVLSHDNQTCYQQSVRPVTSSTHPRYVHCCDSKRLYVTDVV